MSKFIIQAQNIHQGGGLNLLLELLNCVQDKEDTIVLLDKRIVRVPQSDEANKIGMLFACPFVHPSIMARASLLKNMKYDPVWENAEDYELWTRAAAAGVKMTNIPEVLLDYRVHEKQISSVSAEQQSIFSIEIRKNYWEHIRSSIKLNENFEMLLNFEKNNWKNMT